MQPVSILTLAQNDVTSVSPTVPAAPGAPAAGAPAQTGASTGTVQVTPNTTTAPPRTGGGFSDAFPFLMLLAAFAFLFIFQARSSRKEKKKRDEMFASLKKGDKIQTIGGALGSIVEVRENDVTVKFDDTTRIKFVKSAIATVVNDEPESK